MTQDDIIRMAIEAGWPKPTLDVIVDTEMERLERFAALVAQAEREECAQLENEAGIYTKNDFAAAIRARGKA